jgi:DNA-binding NarL/FixJ family response regulator
LSIKIVIADDHPVVRKGLAQFFADEDDLDVVAECADGLQVLEFLARRRADVIVADLRMPNLGGLDLLRRIKDGSRKVGVIILAGNISDDEVVEAMRLGVRGIVLKEMAPTLLVQSVRKVAGGGVWLEKDSVLRAMERLLEQQERREKVQTVLTPREIEIVRMVLKGLGNREIGEALFISEGTVKTHLHSIYEKLGLKGRMQLATYARENAIA